MHFIIHKNASFLAFVGLRAKNMAEKQQEIGQNECSVKRSTDETGYMVYHPYNNHQAWRWSCNNLSWNNVTWDDTMAWDNTMMAWSYQKNPLDSTRRNKRTRSDRYFSNSVISGDVSDIVFVYVIASFITVVDRIFLSC